MSKKSSTYCFCESTRFSGGYLSTPCAGNVIEISLKFEKTHEDVSVLCNSTEKCNLNFLELSHKTIEDVCSKPSVHNCVSELLQTLVTKKPSPEPQNTSIRTTPTIAADVIVHSPQDDQKYELKKRNSSLRSSLKSSHSMETILKTAKLNKDKSPEEVKAKSVNHINSEDDGDEYIENGESIELIFISDEFVNKVQKQEQEVIIVNGDNGNRRESLTNNKKIVIITDEFKQRVLRNNSIEVTNERRMLRKLKKTKTYSTNCEDEKFEIMECKKIDLV